MRLLEGDFQKSLKVAGIKYWSQVLKIFLKKRKFIRFESDQLSMHTLGNFNYRVAMQLHKEGHISKKELGRQRSLFSYEPKGFVFQTLTKYKISSLGEAIDRCIASDGSFKPLGGEGKAIASNYEIAKILHKEKILSEKEFIMIDRPCYGYRKLTDEELGDANLVSINITGWPVVIKRLTVVLYNRRNNVSWDRHNHRNRKLDSISLAFLAKEFLRIPPYSDLPEFKSSGFYLQKLFDAEWIESIEESLSVVKEVLQKHNLLA